jgi:hypothetical protein
VLCGAGGLFGTGQQSRRVQNKNQLRCHMNECGQKWVQKADAGERDTHRVDRDCAGKVLPDDAPRSLSERDDINEADEIVAEQYDIGALARDIRARAHGNADIGFGQRWSVVYAVTQHRDHATSAHKILDSQPLVLRPKIGLDFGNPKLAGNRIGHQPCVAGQKNRANVHVVERVDGLFGLRSHRVRDNDRAEETAITSDQDLGSRLHIGRAGCDCLDPILSKQCSVTHQDDASCRRCKDATPGRVFEAIGF